MRSQIISNGVCDSETAKSVAKRLFQIYDKDQNGLLDQNESIQFYIKSVQQVYPIIIDAYRAMSKNFQPNQNDSESLTKVLDCNQDGKVTYQDIEAFAMRILCGQGQFAPVAIKKKKNYSKAIEERLIVPRRIFQKFCDKDGYIWEKTQISDLLRETYNDGFIPTDEDIRAWIDITDRDGDGKVDLDEFESAIINGLEEAGIKLY